MKPRSLTRSARIMLLFAAGFCLWLPSSSSAATYGQQVVAAVLLAEAASEGRKGMEAVAEVIRNRADHYGISPLAVVKMNRQFSCLNRTSPPDLIRKHLRNPHWPAALAIARTAYNEPERLPGVTKGATHYHSHRRVSWTGNAAPATVIGRLKFYRLNLPR